MTKMGVVCGLQSEAKAVRQAYPDPRIEIRVSGANAERAETLAGALCAQGAGAIISVGISGGLAPHLQPGDMIIGDKVVTSAGEEFACSSRGLDLLTRSHKARAVTPSTIYGADQVIESASQKADLWTHYGAASVDMESHGAARAAKEADVAFLAIRAIADPSERSLPAAALNAVNADGSTKVISTLVNAMKAPAQMPELMQLGADSNAALKTLRDNLGGLFGVLLLGSNLI